jgi:hypothetical protein
VRSAPRRPSTLSSRTTGSTRTKSDLCARLTVVGTSLKWQWKALSSSSSDHRLQHGTGKGAVGTLAHPRNLRLVSA